MVSPRYVHMPKNLGSSFLKAAMPVCLALGFSSSAMANCDTRHFYNNSTVPFTITMGQDAGTCSVGTGPNVKNCVVPAKQVAEIHYENTSATDGFTGQNVAVMRIQSVVYPARDFRVVTGLCKIQHNGNTGNIAVNDPVDGDITTCGAG